MAIRRVLVAYCGLMAALAALIFAVPAVRTEAFVVSGLTSSVAMVYGISRRRPQRAGAWLALASVPALDVVGGVVYLLLPGEIGTIKPHMWVVLVLRLALFVFMLAGLLGLARRPDRERTSLIDLLILLFGAGLLAGMMAALPYVLTPDVPELQIVVRAAYVVSDVVILVAAFNLFTAVRWTSSVALLALGSIGFLAFDAFYLFGGSRGAWPSATPWDLGWLLFLTAWGLAALVASMARLGVGDAAAHNPAPIRLGLVVCSTLLPLALVLAASVLRPTWYVVAFIAAFTIMLALVLVRLVVVTLQLRQQVTGERRLREAVAQLATAQDPVAVTAVVERFVPRLLPKPARCQVLLAPTMEPRPDAVVRTPSDHRNPDRPDGHIGVLTYRLGTASSPDATTTPGQAPGEIMMYVHGGRAALTALRPRLDVLVTQASLTLDRMRLGEEIIRRANEDYFRTLVRTAGDAILMVDDDDRVSLASPSANAVLGTSQLQGTWLPGLVDEAQRQAAEQLLASTRQGQALQPGRALAAAGLPNRSSPDESSDRTNWVNLADWTVRQDDGSTTLVEVSCHRVDDQATARGLVVNLRDVTEQHRLEQELTASSAQDPLTGLPSRLALRSMVRQAVEEASGADQLVAVFAIDLDDFGIINDQLGYEIGDSVLQVLSQRLTQTLPPGGTAGRLGGDAFAALITGVPDPAAVDRVARDVAGTLASPIHVGDQVATCTACIGIATTAEANSVNDLARQAEFALRAAKGMGSGHIRHYDPSMHTETKDRLELRSALDRALEDGAMTLAYQPIVDLETGRTAGFEALLRWQHPTHGQVSPELFIDVAEESGLIEPIGDWAMANAIRQVRRWDRLVPGAPPAYVGVNVSARQFRAPGFIGRIRSQLAASGLAPSRLHLEITESLLLPDDEQVWADLQQLRRLGVRIAIDDFGTGYSALSYLRRVPLDVVKLDRLFVNAMTASIRQRELVKGIVRLAEILNLAVVAEGIETELERDLAANAGCTFGQGFLFARPMPDDEVPVWLTQERDRVARTRLVARR